jgi:L-fuculose-phosphate aldolase
MTVLESNRWDRSEATARRAVVETALAMSRSGLTPGRSGNVSCRWRDGLLVTPSAMPYEEIRDADVVFVGAGGRAPEGSRKPSSETPLHRAIYAARPDVSAIVHAHSLHATALACTCRGIPAFHYMVAVAGGKDVPIAPYATFGSDDLGRHVAAALRERNACLIENHGQVAVASDPSSALALAQEVETLAAQYAAALAVGPPHLLSDEEMTRVLERFRDYRQPDAT